MPDRSRSRSKWFVSRRRQRLSYRRRRRPARRGTRTPRTRRPGSSGIRRRCGPHRGTPSPPRRPPGFLLVPLGDRERHGLGTAPAVALGRRIGVGSSSSPRSRASEMSRCICRRSASRACLSRPDLVSAIRLPSRFSRIMLRLILTNGSADARGKLEPILASDPTRSRRLSRLSPRQAPADHSVRAAPLGRGSGSISTSSDSARGSISRPSS